MGMKEKLDQLSNFDPESPFLRNQGMSRGIGRLEELKRSNVAFFNSPLILLSWKYSIDSGVAQTLGSPGKTQVSPAFKQMSANWRNFKRVIER